ncbi:Goosecoid [Aphelenchoides bicaudatus]|nr:Goosecoid [Aphelenchoides bicaudatus]
MEFNGFPPNSYFGPNTAGLFQSNGMILQQLSGRRKRRHRTIFTDEQLAILEANFSANAYPDIAHREKLAIQCDLKEERVEVWFKNRRAKERKKRHDFPTNENATRGSAESGTVSPFFEQSSSSEHKSDESDSEDLKTTFVANSADLKYPVKLPTLDTQPQNSTSTKRKKPHSDTKEESPVAKRARPSDKNHVKVD